MTQEDAYQRAIQELVRANAEYRSRVTKILADLFAGLQHADEGKDGGATAQVPVYVGSKESFTVAEAAEFLGVSRSKAYELIYSGQLASMQLGRRRIISRHALYALLYGDSSPSE